MLPDGGVRWMRSGILMMRALSGIRWQAHLIISLKRFQNKTIKLTLYAVLRYCFYFYIFHIHLCFVHLFLRFYRGTFYKDYIFWVKKSELQIWSLQTSIFQRIPTRDYVFVFLVHHRPIEHVQKHLFPWSKTVVLVLATRIVRKTKSL